MKYCFGVDVGGTTVKIGLFQADGVLAVSYTHLQYNHFFHILHH